MKLDKLVFSAIIFITPYFAQCQNGVEWQKSLGGSEGETAQSVTQTSDGGYIVSGQSKSIDGDVTGNHAGSYDAWVTKLNDVGTIQWQKCLGGTGIEVAYSIEECVDSGFIIAGFATSNNGDVSGLHGSEDVWVVKLNNIGVIEWQKCLGGNGSERAFAIQQTFDGGYVVAGNTTSFDGDVFGNHGYDAWVIKLNSFGMIEWQKCLGGTDSEVAYSVQQTLDGGFIVAGFTNSTDGDVTGYHVGGAEAWVIKLNLLGAIEWQKCLGGSDGEFAYSIKPTFDGGYIVAGVTFSFDGDVTGNHGGGSDIWIIKLNNLGTIEWQKCLGGSGSEYANSIEQTIDGGYIISGFTSSDDFDVIGYHIGGSDAWMIKLNNFGSIQWQRCFGGSENERANCIQQAADGGFIVSGFNSSIDGDVIGNHGGDDFWVIKLNSVIGIDEFSIVTFFNIFPLPSNDRLNIDYMLSKANDIKLEIKNILGENMFEPVNLRSQYGFNHIQLPVSEIADGVYFLTISCQKETQTKKVIVNH